MRGLTRALLWTDLLPVAARGVNDTGYTCSKT